jgi:hypothetical protein
VSLIEFLQALVQAFLAVVRGNQLVTLGFGPGVIQPKP